jgi:hypothetical protein
MRVSGKFFSILESTLGYIKYPNFACQSTSTRRLANHIMDPDTPLKDKKAPPRTP